MEAVITYQNRNRLLNNLKYIKFHVNDFLFL